MTTTIEAAWSALEQLTDPEIPVISLRDEPPAIAVRHGPDGLEVVITPTYSGCPAMGQIEDDVVSALKAAGAADVVVKTVLSPAWTTDWIPEPAREKLRKYGIAPPGPVAAGEGVPVRFVGRRRDPVACPRCASTQTEQLSAFGSTACKSLWRCLDCKEPFDYFKPY